MGRAYSGRNKKKVIILFIIVFSILLIVLCVGVQEQKRNFVKDSPPKYKPAPTIPPVDETDTDLDVDDADETPIPTKSKEELERDALRDTYEFIYDEDIDNSGYPQDTSPNDHEDASG